MPNIPTRPRRGCFRIGCCSCLGLGLLAIVGLVLLGGSQFLFERNAGPPHREDLHRDLPPLPNFLELVESGEIGNGGKRLAGDSTRFGSLEQLLQAADRSGKVVRLQLELNLGEFEIVRGAAGEGVVVEAKYDERAFRFSEDFTENENGGGVMHLRSVPKGGLLGLMLRGAGRGPKNFVTIKLPPDVPFDLSGSLGLGEAHLDLGGLLLRSVNLELGTGDHRVSFDEPLLVPMEEMILEKGIGELSLQGVGNASPSHLVVRQRIGELELDLRGAWHNDSEITAAVRVGEINIEPSTTARIETHGGGVAIGESNLRISEQTDLPERAPLLTLDLSGGVGEINIH